MAAPPFVEAVHAGWAITMDDKVPLYMTQADSASTRGCFSVGKADIDMPQVVSNEDGDHRPWLVIDNLHDPSALVDPQTEAAIKTKGVCIGYAAIEDNKLPLYQMPEENTSMKTFAESDVEAEKDKPELIHEDKDDDLISFGSNFINHPNVRHTNLDSFEERILQALGGFEMLTIREAYLEASELHANTIGTLPTEASALTGRIGRAAKYCGNVLRSFRSQVLRGLDHSMVTTMLLHLKIVINILGQVFPAHRSREGGIAAPPSTLSTEDNHEVAPTRDDSEVANTQTPDVVSDDTSHGQITHGISMTPVELDAGFVIGEQLDSSRKVVRRNANAGFAEDSSDEWLWENISEVDDTADVLGWEVL